MEETKKKKRVRYRKKKKKQCECNGDCNHECKCNNNCKKDKPKEEPKPCKYDFMKLDTLDDKKAFCQEIYKDIVDCYNNLNHNTVRDTMNIINKYFLYEDADENTLLNLELLNLLREISNNEVKPVWEKTTSGTGINIHVGLSYKSIVFSLMKDF